MTRPSTEAQQYENMPVTRTPPKRKGRSLISVQHVQQVNGDDDAAEYVESVMTTQNVSRVLLTDADSDGLSRKRTYSGEDAPSRTVKKAKDGPGPGSGSQTGSQTGNAGSPAGTDTEHNVIAMLNVISAR